MGVCVGLVQVNNFFEGQGYFPYSAGILQAYAERHLPDSESYRFLLPVFRQMPVAEAADRLAGADIVGFSIYSWTEQLSLAIAAEVKRRRPSTLIVCGGPQVPRHDRPWAVEEFLVNHRYVDLAVHEAGEGPFAAVLQKGLPGQWEEIPSASFLTPAGRLHQNPKYPGFKDLAEVPEPYLAGVFDSLMAEHPAVEWIGLVETDRNCPYQCTWCGWGLLASKPIVRPIEEACRVVEWFGKRRIVYVFFCNANFGINREHDLEIVRHIIKVRREFGFPKAVSLQDGKGEAIGEWVYRIRTELLAGGIETPVVIALQSVHPPTLEAVKRRNIGTIAYRRNQQRFAREGQLTMTDLILAQPLETHDSFADGISTVIDWGQFNRIQFNNLSVVPDAELSHPITMEYYGLETVWTRIVNMHGYVESGGVPERQELVIATSTMPREDWVRTRALCWMVGLLFFDKLLQIPLIVCHELSGTDAYRKLLEFCRGFQLDPTSAPTLSRLLGGATYRQLFEAFTNDRLDAAAVPVLADIWKFFQAKARAIQGGDVEYCHAPDWLNVYWPADEYVFIELATSGKLDQFYAEAERVLAACVAIDAELLRDAIALNRALLKLPFVSDDVTVECSWNVWEYYRGVIEGTPTPIERRPSRYAIECATEHWDTWEQWYREVVWWCNRSGAYLRRTRSLGSTPPGHY